MTIAQKQATAPACTAHHRFEPIVENRRSTLAPGPLRVVAFNAQGGSRFDGILRCFARPPLRTAAVILLSEMDSGTLRSGRRKVASELAEALGMSCAYVPEFGLISSDGTMRAYLGNAILAREPMDDVIAISLPKVSNRELHLPRSLGRLRRQGSQVAIVARVKVRGKAIHLSIAHLDSRAHPNGRDLQIATMFEGFPPAGPAIFGGDLNTTTVELINPASIPMVLRGMLLNSKRFRHPEAYEPLLARLSAAGFEIRGANAEGRATFTFGRAIPPWMRPKLDWIALRGLSPVPGSARVIPARPGFFARRVSDHDFIAVDVAI
jgi:endonuclease/exonuclease/phosphatase family metal-dependent hydrolase